MRTLGFIATQHFMPPTNGGQKVCFELCQALTKRSKIICFSPHQSASIKNLKFVHLVPHRIFGLFDPRAVGQLANALRHYGVSACILNQPFFFPMAFLACKLSHAKLIIYSHNLEFRRRNGVRRLLWPLIFLLEALAYKCSDQVFFISLAELDDAVIRFKLRRSKCTFVPHIIGSISNFHPKKRIASKNLELIFFGNFDFPPNKIALAKLLDKIAPLLATVLDFPCTLTIFGSSLSQSLAPRTIGPYLTIAFCGFVDDVTGCIAGADVLISPVNSGAGVQTKIIETIALGTKVITAKNGARGIDASMCEGALICVEDEDWQSYVDAILDVKRGGETHHLPSQKFLSTYTAENVVNTVLNSIGA